MSEHTITELLSPAFLSRMQNMLGDEYESFLKSYEAPRTYGLRVNTAKISCDEFERIVPFPVTPIPWISNGYFYPEDVRPSFCPLYQAGLFYHPVFQSLQVKTFWTFVLHLAAKLLPLVQC